MQGFFEDDYFRNTISNRRAMMAYLPERENVVERVDSLCLQLFDTCCETRNVTPLAYLLHCWPLTDSATDALRRVGETMRYLRRHHADQLDAYGFHARCEMADLIDEQVEHPARTVRLTAVCQVPHFRIPRITASVRLVAPSLPNLHHPTCNFPAIQSKM